MDAVDVIRRLHEHRVWVNAQLLDACASLDEVPLRQAFAIGQGSIWRSLLHLYAAEYVWLEALLGNDDPLLPGDVPGELPGNQKATGGVTSLDDLRTKWAALDSRWVALLAALREDALADVVYKWSTSSGRGQRWGTTRGDVLLHVCTHAQYTTAQIVNMLRQSSVTALPDVMLISLARKQLGRPAGAESSQPT